ncbi:MAG: ABC transporter substrate-binding protein [Clostridiales bacterium]|nr:ABC transporter substrate-binding protein [Clostridiales bacterium]
MLLAVFALCACAGKTARGGNVVVCAKDDYSNYSKAAEQMLNGYRAAHANGSVFRYLKEGAACEVFAAQADSALKTGLAMYWYPQYLATVVIAVDRDLTDARISGWGDLKNLSEEVGYIAEPHFYNEMLLSAISYGLEGENFTFSEAAALLGNINAQNRLVMNSAEPPVLICFDYNAAALIKNGRNLEIVVPREGTYSFEKGLMSETPLSFAISADELLVSSGLRLVNGGMGAPSLYPEPSAYKNAQTVTDYRHINAASLNAVRVLRRDILRTRMYSSSDGREHQYWVLFYIVIAVIWSVSVIRRAVQKNVRRAALFTHSRLGLVIADSSGTAWRLSANAAKFNADVAKSAVKACPAPVMPDENTLIFALPITGGYALWREDITRLNRLHAQMKESVAKLKAANILLAEEEKLKRALQDENEKTRLMTQLEAEIAGHVIRLNTMAEQLENVNDRPKATARLTLLLCYIKRRLNVTLVGLWDMDGEEYYVYDVYSGGLGKTSYCVGYTGVWENAAIYEIPFEIPEEVSKITRYELQE